MEIGVSAQLSVRRGPAAVEFYRAAFGAVEVFRTGDTEIVAQLAVGNTSFWVEDESPEHRNFSLESLGGGTVRLLLLRDDPRAVVRRAVEPGPTEGVPVQEADRRLLGRFEDPLREHSGIRHPAGRW